ncbi:MAG: choice-of-anchor Q domain-containing protein [Chthoniobacterales bacterium]
MRPSLSRFPLAALILFVLLCAVLAGTKFSPSTTTFCQVTSTADSGPGTLRDRVAAAGDGSVVYFATSLTGATITLTSGEIAINSNITIDASAAVSIKVTTQDASFRIFHVLPGHSATINSLTIKGGGGVNGACILNDHAALNLRDCVIRGGIVSANSGYGGGIYNDGSGSGEATLTITGCLIVGNRAGDAGGGIYNTGSGGGSATVSMSNSSVIDNFAGHSGIPIGSGAGGGIANEGAASSMTLTNCLIDNNRSGSNDASPAGMGGGISNSGTLTLIGSTISNNQCFAQGGGIFSSGNLAISSSTVSGNIVNGSNGGVGSGDGGGILGLGTLTLANSTVSNNSVTNKGGGIHGSGIITNSTISDNAAANAGGGIFANGSVEIGNTILKAGASGANIVGNPGSVTSLGYNLSSDGGGGFLTATGDQINTDPVLGPLQENSGPTFTHAPLNGSPAIDAGDPGFTPPPSEDQRGLPRVFNGRIDIGSVEVQPVPTPTPTPTPGPSPCGYILTFSESFDGVTAPALPPGWTSSFTAGAANCTPSGACTLGTNWVTTNATPYSPPHCVFHNAPGCVTDSFLESPSFRAGPTNVAFLNFRHSFDLENGRDGAVLEISIEGGPFVDFAAIGGFPGYNGTIASDSLSPIAGRAAWTGNSEEYQPQFMTFPQSAQGRNVRLRFRLATDCGGGGGEWRIDDIRVEDNIGCQPPTPPPTPTPRPPTPTPGTTPTPCPAMTFAGTGVGAIPDGLSGTPPQYGPPLVVSFAVSGQTAPLAAVSVDVTLNHSWAGDVDMVLTSPGGTASLVTVSRIGVTGVGSFGDSSNYSSNFVPITSYNFTDAANGTNLWTAATAASCGDACQILTGDYRTTAAGAAGQSNPPPVTSLNATFGGLTTAQINGTWTLAVRDASAGYTGSVTSANLKLSGGPCPPNPTPTAAPTPTPSRALNISTRLRVENGDRVMIGGFIITGSGPKRVVLRGIGPSLANFGVPDVLADPVLELRDASGALLLTNDNWQDNATDEGAQLVALGLAPQHPKEAAFVANLPSGASYTAILTGKNGGAGVGLVEVYDTDQGANSQLANISTRGFVQGGDNVMIGGFTLGDSNGGTSVVVRGIGPSLSQFGLSNVLGDPTLELRDSNGMLLKVNDNWQDDSVSAAQLTARGLAPQNSLESGIFASLPAGAFTAILAGKNSGSGIGLIEIYNVQ